MKRMKKLLWLVLAVGLACIVAPKEVKADVSFTYTEGTGLSWAGDTIKKLEIGGVTIDDPASPYALSNDDLRTLLGSTAIVVGDNSLSISYSLDGTTFNTGSFTVTGYAPNVTISPNHGSIEFTPEAGFKGDTYDGEWTGTAGEEYTIKEWDNHTTNAKRTGMEFGASTPYTLTLTHEKSYSVTPDPGTTELTGGDSQNYTIKILPEDVYDGTGNLTATISDNHYCSYTVPVPALDRTTSPATLSLTGIKGNGTFKIDIKDGATSIWDKPKTVTVSTPISTLNLTDKTALLKGQSADYTITIPDAAKGTYVDWDVSDESVLQITENVPPGDKTSYKIKGLKAGTATLTVKAYSNGTNTGSEAIITETKIITVGDAPNSITIAGTDPLEIAVGQDSTLSVTADPTTASNAVTWSSSNPAVATVDANGKVHGVAVGSTVITAKSIFNDKTATRNVNVKTAAEKVKITSDTGNPDSSISFTLPAVVEGLSSVKGVTVALYSSSGKLLYEKDYTMSPGERTLSADDIEELIEDAGNQGFLSGSGDSGEMKIGIKISPMGIVEGKTTTDDNKTAGDDAKERTVYFFKITGENISQLKKEDGLVNHDYKSIGSGKYYFGQKGYKAKITVKPKDNYEFSKWDDDSKDNPRTYTFGESYESKNLKAVAGAKNSKDTTNNGSGDGNAADKSTKGLDKVPKTGEGKFGPMIILIAVMLASLCSFLMLYYVPARKAKSTTDSVKTEEKKE